MWQEGKHELLKYLGFENEEGDLICLYFADCKLPYATPDPHYLFFSVYNFQELKLVLKS